jgi:hypothetical protein
MYFQKVQNTSEFQFYVDANNIVLENNASVDLIVYLNDFKLFEISGNSSITLNCIRLYGFLKFKNSDNSNLNFKFLAW